MTQEQKNEDDLRRAATADDSQDVDDIASWISDKIKGVGGFDSYVEHEWGARDDHQAAVEFVVRCIGNPNCEGAESVAAQLARRHGLVIEADDTEGWIKHIFQNWHIDNRARLNQMSRTERAAEFAALVADVSAGGPA